MAGAMEAMDSLDTRQSKQRASIKWLLSKAFNNRVPDNLHEPFYRDHEEQEHLKPPIVGGLANAELYCLALANMYSDPNYHSLNHWNILQTLSRKGVHVPDPPDAALTETVLIQTNPIRMSAHMAVIEALMVLYAREVVTPERVCAAAQRFGGAPAPPAQPAASAAPHEDGLLAWINAACAALNRAESEESPAWAVPSVKSLQELCDGTALAALVSFYCPDALPRDSVRVGRVSSLQDCLHNLMLVQEFCQRFLPHNIFHMLPEDVTYMRGSMRQNLIAMLADLFNMLEVHPVKCVKYPGTASGRGSNEHGVRHKRCLPPPPPAPIPDLRADRDPPADPHTHAPFTVPRSPSASVVGRGRGAAQRSACSTPERRSASPLRAHPSPAAAAPLSARHEQQEEFVVHRGKGVTTLSSMARQPDDRGVPEDVAAGRPSNWEDTRGSSAPYAGRRSRRSSISDDSQLTVENFGGSQDRLNFCGRNPEKELATVGSVRKISAPAGPVEPAVPVRTLKQDIRGSLQFMYDEYPNGAGAEDPQRGSQKPLERQYSQPPRPDPPYTPIRRQHSSDTITLKQNYSKGGGAGDGFYLNNNTRDITDGDISNNKLSSFADMRLRSNGDQSVMQVMYDEPEDVPTRKKSTSFVTPQPHTTTWRQQSVQHHPNGDGDKMSAGDEAGAGGAMAAQLNNIRLKLEEKRRRIEQDKRRMELSMNRQRQHVGQQAFLQAVTRSKAGGGGRTPGDEAASSPAPAPAPAASDTTCTPKPYTLQEISTEAASVESRWLEGDGGAGGDARGTPDLDGMGIEEYQQSIAKMNSSLHDIQTDIARLASQQSQLQSSPLTQQHQAPPAYPHHQHHQPPPQPNIPQLHSQYSSQHNVSSGPRLGPSLHNSSFGSTPHIPHEYQAQRAPRHDFHQGFQQEPVFPQNYQQEQYGQGYGQEQQYGQSPRQFYLHDTPSPVQRRTWAQQARAAAPPEPEQRGWQFNQQINQQQQHPHQLQQPQQQQQHQHQLQQQHHQYQQPFHEPQRTWKSPSPQPAPPVQDTRWNPQSFVLADRTDRQPFPVHYSNPDRYHNGDDSHPPQNHLSYTVINPIPAHHRAPSQSPPPLSSPQRRSKTPQRQGSLPENVRRSDSVSLQQLSSAPAPHAHAQAHVPVAAPPADDMEPQNISFIGSAEEDALQHGINRLNISSGTRTYRIPSPTRPSLNRNSFQQPVHESSHSEESAEGGDPNELGFYISFDNEQPKRPKPPLRAKKGSPRKERTPTEYHSPERDSPEERAPWQERVAEPFAVHRNVAPSHSALTPNNVSVHHRETPPRERLAQRESSMEPAAIVIGENVDPNSAEEMEKKKERIMLLSLQRRARAEEARARAEAAAAARRARDDAVAEQRLAKKEEQARRREAILHQYKLKKAIDEAEREGKVLDKAELLASLKPSGMSTGGSSPSGPSGGPRLRGKTGAAARARPKTIHVDSGALEAAEGMLARKQASSTNLTAYGPSASGASTMRRDYYRGSQDSLADRAGLYRDSPVEESRGMSPGAGSNSSALGRRGSYKTSRERVNEVEPPPPVRGRSKYSTYQNNFKAGRKSSSLMNLCDSGLGRATPPRRAASPGVRVLTSPAGSGPGSLPGGIGKRTARHHLDDNSSDVSSTHSSIMDYSGPRLYKQPATKSNRGIMLNAVEYCVFPGAVNKEAKRRVLEEIARSESKHFLVLFRDAGCQFRALYSFCPDTESVTKLYGTGPKQVNDRMFDKFFKYNSGSKCFSQIHTKHLTVTIDAFTIHNSLWQGKKVQLPSKKDMALVI